MINQVIFENKNKNIPKHRPGYSIEMGSGENINNKNKIRDLVVNWERKVTTITKIDDSATYTVGEGSYFVHNVGGVEGLESLDELNRR